MKKQLNSILVKPSGPDCNLECEYCFYLEKEVLYKNSKIHRMNDKVLEEMIRQVMEQSGEQVSIAWQGGEPTQMGLDFFKRAIEFEKQYGGNKLVGNGFQTNGLLLDAEWADFFVKYNFLVGLSIDGPQHVHDYYRYDKAGNPTWEKVYNNGKMLLQHGVAVNSLSCVTDYSWQYPEEIYDFLREMGFDYMQFIPIVETDVEFPSRAAHFSVNQEQYGEFLCRIFDKWENDFKDGKPQVSVRIIDSIFHRYVGLDAPECTHQRECGVYLVVEHNGDVYACDFFVEPTWKLGNILKDRMIDLLNSRKQELFGKKKANLNKQCKTCPWLQYCYGGCTKDRLRDPRDNKHNHFCESYKMFFRHVDEKMKSLARQWMDQQKDFDNQAEYQEMFRRRKGDTYFAFDDF